MRCVICAEPMPRLYYDSGQSVCEACSPRDNTSQTMERLWGPKCSSNFDQDCVLCHAWRFFEAKGLVPTVEDVFFDFD